VIDEAVSGFPCFYTFKVFGRQRAGFSEQVRATIAARVGTVPLDCIKVRPSGRGNYVCVSVVTHVRSREQLEEIYRDLGEQTEVLLYL
jgi:hypothetical protein